MPFHWTPTLRALQRERMSEFIARGRELFPDWDAVVMGRLAFQVYLDADEAQALLQHPDGPRHAYHLCKRAEAGLDTDFGAVA